MKNLVFLGLLGLGTPAFADKVCWDGTFGYNYARAVATDAGMEISIQGSNLDLPLLTTDSGASLQFDNFSGREPKLHILFPKNSLKTDGDLISAAVSSTEDDIINSRNPKLWVEYGVTDLEKTRTLISPVPLKISKMKLSQDFIQIDITQLWGYDPSGSLRQSTIQVDCAYSEAPDTLRFPKRLKKYLSTQ